jgi:hypothetical protein
MLSNRLPDWVLGCVGEGQMKLIPENVSNWINRIIIIKIKRETFKWYYIQFVQFWLIYIKEEDEWNAGGEKKEIL